MLPNLSMPFAFNIAFIIALLPIIAITYGGMDWGGALAISLVDFVLFMVYMLYNENERVKDVRWNHRNGNKSGDGRWSIIPVFIFPALLIAATYWSVINPMMDDYNNAVTIDRELPMDAETKMYHNDNNRIFVLFLDKAKQPLVIDLSGSSETYNRMKADFLDSKTKVTKREKRDWTDEESTISYTLDGHSFN
jgi:hypothetical protein